MKDGSYSVEAAFVMPVVIVLMLIFLMLGFYMRDVVFTEAYARNLLLEMADDTAERKNKDYVNELKGCLWCAKVDGFSILEAKGKIEVKYKLLSGIIFIKIRIDKTLSIEPKEKTAEKLRKWRVITDTAKGLLVTEGE